MSNNLVEKPQWQNLKNHCAALQKEKIISFFDQDGDRVQSLSCALDGLFFDYSKQHITAQTIEYLCDLARDCDLEAKRDAMFSGDKINNTENRAVLHTALRAPNPPKDIAQTLNKIQKLSDAIRNGSYRGATGKAIKHIVSLGTGGSDLGPRLVCHALKTEHSFPVSFVTNIDDDDLNDVLFQCDPETTLFIVISKSFGTQETLINFERVKTWLAKALPEKSNIMAHFIAVTANEKAAKQFGFTSDNLLPMWDWVNGRFSVWSAVGLPIAISLGFEKFQEFLQGGYQVDCHFKNAPLDKNIPVLMALIGVWNINFMGLNTLALLPYANRLGDFVPYIQQLDMESNGKSVDRDGVFITDYQTAPTLFGAVGTNGQHSFYQQIHQGSTITPCDFIGFQDKNKKLLNNMLAQSQALMTGQSHDNPHQYFNGNRPSSLLLFDTLCAKTLGMLIALYEHKIFVQGVIWNINSFDQFGVELGKKLAQTLDHGDLSHADASTRVLYDRINNFKK